MRYTTPEIIRTLKLVKDEDLFKREDVVYARQHRHDSNVKIREELLKTSPDVLWALRNRGLLREESLGYTLTNWGSSLLEEFENSKRVYGAENVNLILVMREGIVSYRVKINPKALEIVQEPPQTAEKPKIEFKTPKIVEQAKETASEAQKEEYKTKIMHLSEFLSGRGIESDIKNLDIERWLKARGDDSLYIHTRIPYFRTTSERKMLDEIAENLKMDVKSDAATSTRTYTFSNGRNRIAVMSKKSGKASKTCEPLQIRIDLKQPIESAEELIKSLHEKFRYQKF